MVIKETTIKKTRKVHLCMSCEWLTNGALDQIRSGEIKLTFAELRSVVKAKQNKWRIPKGSSCGYRVGIWEGDFCAFHFIPEIDKICSKYDIYET